MNRLESGKIKLGDNYRIAPSVLFLQPERTQREWMIRIGDNVTIRDGTIIYAGVRIGDNVTIDHYCVIRESVVIGNDVRVMNFSEINRDVEIGPQCRIAGYLANRVKVGKRTSAFGYLLHEYPIHGAGMIEDSPVVGNDVVVGRLAVIAGNVKVKDGQRVRAGDVLFQGKRKRP